jgi:hypothetical protein
MSEVKIMNRLRAALCVGLLCALGAPERSADATTVKHFDLTQMTSSAARVFRGTVMDVNPGTVRVGGGELPTTTYRIKVVESFKGDFKTAKGVAYAEITMIGSIKADSDKGGLRHFSLFRDMPRLERGQDYLLFLTADSKVALTSPVGLAQGLFDIDTALPEEPTANRLMNSGLAAGVKGPVPYDQLAARVRDIVAAQKGGL